MYCFIKASDMQAGGRAGRSLTHIHILLYEILLTSAIKRLVTVSVFEVVAVNLNTDKICTCNKFVQQVT